MVKPNAKGLFVFLSRKFSVTKNFSRFLKGKDFRHIKTRTSKHCSSLLKANSLENCANFLFLVSFLKLMAHFEILLPNKIQGNRKFPIKTTKKAILDVSALIAINSCLEDLRKWNLTSRKFD